MEVNNPNSGNESLAGAESAPTDSAGAVTTETTTSDSVTPSMSLGAALAERVGVSEQSQSGTEKLNSAPPVGPVKPGHDTAPASKAATAEVAVTGEKTADAPLPAPDPAKTGPEPQPGTVAAELKAAQEAADKHGFRDVDEYVATMRNRETAMGEAAGRITAALQTEIDEGRITREAAEELYERRMDAAERDWDSAISKQLADRKTAEADAVKNVETITRDATAAYAAAAAANPLLQAGGGAAKDIVLAYALTGVAETDEAVRLLSEYTTAVGQKAVADHAAAQNAAQKNTAPVVPAGGGQGGAVEQTPIGLGQALRNLVGVG